MTGLRFPFSVPPAIAPSGTDETSQLLLKQLPGMLRVCDRVGPINGLRLSSCLILLSACLYNVSVPDFLISRFNGWPAGFPCQRFAFHLAMKHA